MSTPTMFDTPPHSPEAEKTVLGALLLDPEAIVKISDFLLPSDFYDPTFREIYQAVFDLYMSHEPIDFITVSNRLAESKLVQAIGGSAFLAEIASSVPTSSHVYQYGQIVKSKALHRNIIEAGRKIIGLGYEVDKTIPEILDEVEKSVFQLRTRS
jgi:replicative DNA helicase